MNQKHMTPSFLSPRNGHWIALALAVGVAGCSAKPHADTSRRSTPEARLASSSAASTDVALQRKLAEIATRIDGTVAVSVQRLPSGPRASVHGDTRLPMMSVFKLPLAIVALSLVDEGSLRLDDPVPLAEVELRPGVSPIAEEWVKGLRAPSLRTLIERMLVDSDNTAGDKLVKMAGGGARIMARLRALELQGVEIAEEEIEIDARIHCPGVAPPNGGWTVPAIKACPKVSRDTKLVAAQNEVTHARNAATTDALVDMLARLDRGAMLRPNSRAWLSETLAKTKPGPRRLKGALPEGTRIEHRTGTGETIQGLNVATNDIGVITTSSGQRIAIAVLVAGSHADEEARDAVIAALARAAYDSASP